MTERARIRPNSSEWLVSGLGIILAIGFLMALPSGMMAAKPSDSGGVASRDRIIPPPLKDLGRSYKVRLVYFVPSDCEAKPKFREKTEMLMRVVADIYRREMKANKQTSRGLDFEFHKNEKLKVHLVKGRNPAVFYRGKPPSVDRLFRSQQQEIMEATGFIRNRAVLVFSEAGGIAEAAPIPQFHSGFAVVSGDIFRDETTAATIEAQIEKLTDATPLKKKDGEKKPELRNRVPQVSNGVLIHELGHIFGMLHDSSNTANIMYYGYHQLGKMYDRKTAKQRPVRFSLAHARMAAATRFLSEDFDEADRKPPVIHEFKLARTPKAGDKTVDFVVKISDDHGIRALVILQRGGEWIDAKVGDGDLKGKKLFDKTVTLKCPRPLGKTQPVRYIINVIDVNGNLGQKTVDSKVLPK
jgi:hypothetical protein